MATTHIHMGTITRPHGIKGELCVDWYADSPEALRGQFFLQAGQEPLKAVSGAKVRMHKGRPLLTLPHVQDRNEAETLRGMRIYVDRASLPELENDEAYIHDILGFNIIDSTTDTVLGVLENIEFPTESQMLWHIRAPQGQEILLPAVEEFIDGFDAEQACVYVTPPQGLVELYMSEAENASKDKASAKAKKSKPKASPKASA